MRSHDTLAAEAAAFLEVLAGRLQRYAEPPSNPDAPHDAQRCTGCPICVALTYFDEHREVGLQLAQGMLTVVTALRQYIPAGGVGAESSGSTDAAAADGASAPDGFIGDVAAENNVGNGAAGSVAAGSGVGSGATGGAAARNGVRSRAAEGAVQRIDIR